MIRCLIHSTLELRRVLFGRFHFSVPVQLVDLRTLAHNVCFMNLRIEGNSSSAAMAMDPVVMIKIAAVCGLNINPYGATDR